MSRHVRSLLILACCFCLGLGAFCVWGAAQWRQAIETSAAHDAQAQADAIASALAQNLHQAQAKLAAIERAPSVQEAAGLAQRLGLSLLDPSGGSLPGLERLKAEPGASASRAALFAHAGALYATREIGPPQAPFARAIARLDAPSWPRGASTAWAGIFYGQDLLASQGTEPQSASAGALSHADIARVEARLPLGERLSLWRAALALSAFVWAAISFLAFWACAGALRQERAQSIAASAAAERSQLLEDIFKTRQDELLIAQRRLESAGAQEIESDKLSLLGALVAGVSHELATPLGNLELCLSSLADSVERAASQLATGSLKKSQLAQHLEDSGERARLARASCERCAQLVKFFKQVSIDHASEPSRLLDLAEIARDALDCFSPALKSTGVHVHFEAPPLAECVGPVGAIAQILANLLQNATRHAFAGRSSGRLDLRVALEGREWALIEVQDDGSGMAPDVLARAFEPYFTTQAASGGSGLGLSIAKRQAIAMGGSLEAVSPPGQGCLFRLRLPRMLPD